MADAHFLYMIMAVVLVGLASWVIAVNIWAPKRAAVPPPPAAPLAAPPTATSDLTK